MTSLIVFLFLLALFLGLPLYIVLFGLSMYLFTTVEQLPLISSVISFQKIQSQEFISAIPLFTFAGYILAKSKSPSRIVNLFKCSLSFIPGSEAATVLVIMALFTALTGASGVSILALGGLMAPLLKSSGKTDSFSLGLITSSGSIGLLFAPSLPVIIYALIASQNLSGETVNINTLFRVALMPSVILIGVLTIYSIWNGNAKTGVVHKTFDLQQAIRALKLAKYELPLPFVVYGGIYSGFFTVMEASIVTAFYVFLVVFWVQRDLSFRKDFSTIIVESMKLSGGIFIIMASAFILTNYLVDQEIPEKVFSAISPLIQSKIAFLLVINIFLLLCGCFLDIFSAILIVLPIIIPIVERYAIDPYHFAIIFLINLEIGYLTPPMGMNLFIASYRFKKPITKLYRASFPFLLIMLGVLLLVTYIPQISLFTLQNKENHQLNRQLDFTSPAVVTQWRIVTLSTDFAMIEFKSVGDDELIGVVHHYDVRYFDEVIKNEDDFDFAEEILVNDPVEAGNWQRVKLEYLEPGTDYWIVVRAVDEANNISDLSSNFKIKTKID